LIKTIVGLRAMSISKHIIATSKEQQNHSLVDVAGIEERKNFLPGGRT
jgi:hypothetical protein